jgi:hypothetical protein
MFAPLDGLTGSAGGIDAGGVVGAADGSPAVDAEDESLAPLDAAAPDTGNSVDSGPKDSALDEPSPAPADAGASYESTVLADTPLAYWRVDEASGAVAHDVTGNGNDAKYTGGVTFGSGGALVGSTDTAVTLDGKTGFIDAGDKFGFPGNAPYTLEIWALPQNLDTSYQRLFSREVQTTPRQGYLMFVRVGYTADPSTFSLERWSGGQTNQCPEANAVLAVWHHFVATYDGSTSRIYLDGSLAAAQPASTGLATTSASLWVGASIFDTAGYFGGVVDEVAVYGTALSASRIAAHYHASGR